MGIKMWIILILMIKNILLWGMFKEWKNQVKHHMPAARTVKLERSI
jgi:hypothetical protein